MGEGERQVDTAVILAFVGDGAVQLLLLSRLRLLLLLLEKPLGAKYQSLLEARKVSTANVLKTIVFLINDQPVNRHQHKSPSRTRQAIKLTPPAPRKHEKEVPSPLDGMF